ncbi:MAG: hypothetical protein IPK17_32460 [Chloroflexi bacterium]|uniref:hypothetical protein n=1 Tax=Candidatus Flexifilum breve TaxID=3140694 RepID=UPI003134A9E5|nr:hypothetical protein [Chloroflexota bacterium]
MTIRDLREQFASTLIGKRLQSAEIAHQTAPNFIALAVLASDAMSSVAYATEEILIILSTAALTGFTSICAGLRKARGYFPSRRISSSARWG